MEKVLSYKLHTEDLERTAGGLVNLVLKNCVRVTGHEISAAKFTPGGITCDGAAVRVSDRMKPGQTLRVVLPEREDARKLIPTEGELRVLYEDADLLAVDKPAGEAVHPCPGHYADTTANHAAYYLCRGGADGSGGLRIAGRLDKETSGVLIFAKSRTAAARLQRQRRDGRLVRTYLAVCEGTFPAGDCSGTVSLPLERVPGDLMKMRVSREDPAVGDERAQDEGRAEKPQSRPLPAVTHYEVLAQTGGDHKSHSCHRQRPDSRPGDNSPDGRSLLRITIETGRTHQIRVHMAAIGHPLVGDTLYGLQAPQQAYTKSMPEEREENADYHPETADGGNAPANRPPISRALLHAACIRLEQPFTGEKIRIEAPLPADFSAAAGDWFSDLSILI